MRSRYLMALWVTSICTLASGCTSLMLPRFDGGVLNPDLRYLQTREVLEGVKCAVTAFMHDREKKLLAQRLDPRNEALFEDYELNFQAYALNVPKNVPKKCNRPGMHWEKGVCRPNDCNSEDISLGVSLWDYGGKKGEAGCKAVPDYSNFALDPTQLATITLTLAANNTGQIDLARIDALAIDPRQLIITPGGGSNGAPFPRLLASDKGSTTLDFSAQMPQTIHGYVFSPLRTPRGTLAVSPPRLDYRNKARSRDGVELFAYDTEDLLRMQSLLLSLKSTPDKKINDEAKALIEETEGRSDSASVDLIQKNAKSWGTRVTDYLRGIALQETSALQLAQIHGQVIQYTGVAQTLIQLMTPEDAEEFAQLFRAEFVRIEGDIGRRLQEADTLPGFHTDVKEKSDDGKQKDSNKKKPENKFGTGCNFDTSRLRLPGNIEVDYLGLKNMLNKFMDEQDRIYPGLPEITLNTLNLTSSFVIAIDASAGMASPIFHIFPVLAPPSAQLKTDHTHTLKLSFTGIKQKKNKAKAKLLSDSCKGRFANIEDSKDICNTQIGLLLEQLIQNTQSSGSSGQ